jgi:protein-tyrosine phosphatase
MAEVFLKSVLPSSWGKRVEILSAGTLGIEKAPADEHAVKVMAEIGVDLSRHISQGIRKRIIEQANLILVMAEHHKVELIDFFPEYAFKIFLLKEYRQLEKPDDPDIKDPIGGDISDFRHCRNEIQSEILRILAPLSTEIEQNAKE